VTGQSFTNEVMRDDCIEGQGYCVSPCSSLLIEKRKRSQSKEHHTEKQALDQSICLPLKNIEDHCETDRECKTVSVPFDERSYQFNCGHDQKCLIPDEARTRVPPWVYGVVGLTLAAGELPVV